MPADPTYDPALYNEDLAPVPPDKRTWGMWNIAALWIGMAVCITTYTLASSLITAGMNWWQALLTVTLGNAIVLVPMVLNAHAGTKYGIPFPVLLRASFGTRGANLPALLRAFVACGWFGIQTWIGGSAIYTLHSVIFGFTPVDPSNPAHAHLLLPIIGLSLGQLGCFLLFWAINMYFIVAGTESIKWMETLAAPFLLLVGAGLLWWGVGKAGGFAIVLSEETVAKVRGPMPAGFDFWTVFWPSLTAMVGYWATLSLNIPDFTRYSPTQRDQMLGQLIGLPTTMAFYAFIGIAVTAASVVIFGQPIWDPVALIGKFDNVVLVGFALFALSIATLSTNIAANVVSPANDFSNLAPRLISFRTGGIMTGVIGILMFPWKLYADPQGYIFKWLIGYGSLLGSVGGVMLADYFLVRGGRLNVAALYDSRGEYAFGGSGWNWRAVAAVLVGIAPNIPGFYTQLTLKAGEIAPPTIWNELYTHSWFVALSIAAIVHVVLNKLAPVAVSATQVPVDDADGSAQADA